MAINLASHHKAPAHIIRELKAVRAALQKDGADISNRRNQAVHGVHKDATDAATFTLTMFSWNIAKRHKDLTPEDFYALTEEIHALQRRAYGVFEDIGRWKFPGHGEVNRSNDLGAAPPAIRLKLAQRLYASIQHFWRNLFS